MQTNMPVSITKQIEVLETEATHIRSRIQRYRITLDDKQTKLDDHVEYLESEITKQEIRLKENRTRCHKNTNYLRIEGLTTTR